MTQVEVSNALNMYFEILMIIEKNNLTKKEKKIVKEIYKRYDELKSEYTKIEKQKLINILL